MAELILRFLPSWLVPFLIALAAWYGVNYFWITPEIVRRISYNVVAEFIPSSSPEEIEKISNCHAEVTLDHSRLYLAAWTATGGLLGELALLLETEEYQNDAGIRVIKGGIAIINFQIDISPNTPSIFNDSTPRAADHC